MSDLRMLVGDVWTGDPALPRAAAVRFDAANGEILEVSTRFDAGELPEPFVERLPAGSLLIPAFHDAHNHWGFAAFAHAADLHDARDAAEIEDRLAARHTNRGGGWLLGCRWNTGAAPELSAANLDRISTTRPIAVFDKSTHSALLNRRAAEIVGPLAKAAIAEGSPLKFDAGKLVEGSFLIYRAFEFPEDELRAALSARQQEYLRLGVASKDDLDVLSPQMLRTLKSLYATGELFLPCRGFLDFGRFGDGDELRPDGVGAFAAAGLKDYADGAFGAYSAALSRPFENSTNFGLRLLDRKRFLARWRRAESRGFGDLAVHAIGDRAADDALNMLAEVRRSNPDARLRLEHAQLLSPTAPARLRDLDIAVCMQPNFVSDVVDYADRLGDRVGRLCAHRTVVEAGVTMGFGSDGMPTGPLHGIACAVGHPNAAERLSVEDALRRYTLLAHRVSGTDKLRGTIAAGREATFTLLDRDILNRPDEVASAQVLGVYLAGRRVFSSARRESATT